MMKARKLHARHLLTRLATFCVLTLALAFLAVEAQCQPAGQANPAQEEEQQLIALLQSEAPAFDKDKACRRLAVIGTEAAVPALAALLGHDNLCDVARYALETIPGPAPDEAFRAALDKLKGMQLVGVMRSLGNRRDAKAVQPLTAFLSDADPAVASAAAGALGEIGGPAAAKALTDALVKAAPAVRVAVGDGCIALADGLLLQGKPGEAVPVYDAVRKADLPKHILAAATRGAVLARQAAGIPLLIELLKSDDQDMLGIGLRLARELPGADATKALAAALANLPQDRQLLLLQALGDRRDPAAVPAILQVAKTGEVSLRVIALRVLGQIGDPAALPALIEAVAAPEAEIAQAATDTLSGFPRGKEVDAAIVAMIEKGETKLRLAAIEFARLRSISSATPALLKAADDADDQVRAAAFRALGATLDVAGLGTLANRLVKPAKPQDVAAIESALAAACTRIPDKASCARALLAVLTQSQGASKCALVRLLAVVGGADALQAVRAAAKDADPQVQDAAIRALSTWPTVEAAADLAEIAKTSANPTHRSAALGGYVRLSGLADLPAKQKLAMCQEAMGLAKTDAEKKAVLAGLGGVAHPEVLRLIEPWLGDAAVRAEAEQAVFQIAQAISGASPDEAKAALNKLVASSTNAGIKKQAQDLLRQMARFEDYITGWQVAGPYSQQGKGLQELFDIAFDPEKPGATGIAWRLMAAGTDRTRPFMLDLGLACGGGDQRVAYVRTWVSSDKEQRAQLQFGTDDGNKVWLNGELVHSSPGGGAAVPEEHKVDVSLKQGWNAILIKVTQDTGPWEFCFRIRTPENNKLDGLRVRAVPPEE